LDVGEAETIIITDVMIHCLVVPWGKVRVVIEE